MESIERNPLRLVSFDVNDIMEYCQKVNDTICPDVTLNFLQLNRKATKMFQEKFIHQMKVQDEDDSYIVRALCKAEMKKNVKYEVTSKIMKNNKVVYAKCKCAGGDGLATCKHSLALLYAIQNYSAQKLYAAPTEVLQRWHQKKVIKCAPTNLYVANDYLNSNIAFDLNFSSLHALSLNAPFFDVVNPSQCNKDDIAYSRSIPLPAVVIGGMHTVVPECAEPIENMFLHCKVVVTLDEAIAIEKSTVRQGESGEWKTERVYRLTASKFHTICHRVSAHDVLAKRLYEDNGKDLSFIDAVAYGRESENGVKAIIAHKFSDYIFRNTGLIVNPLFPFLGASPDGLLYAPGDPILVEVKCVFNKQGLSLSGLCQSRPNFCLENDENSSSGYKLRKRHAYMYQIQGQMALANLNSCLFVLFYKAKTPVYIEKVAFDKQMWDEMYIKLRNFYFQYYLPFLVKNESLF